MIFIVVIVILLAFVALWSFDLHKTVYMKFLSQNAGDGAALAAARWQGLTLNLVGDLNVLKAVALTQGDAGAATAIEGLQARLCYVGPIVGLAAAQQAAKNNGVFVSGPFTTNLMEHAEQVLYDYPSQVAPDGTLLFPEPYPGCWAEYGQMLLTLASDGIAAAPDNAKYYMDYAGSHILLEPAFYDAVATEAWCWFYNGESDLLDAYTDYLWWPDLPPQIPQPQPMNSEIFGLGLTKVSISNDFTTADVLEALRVERQLGGVPITNTVLNLAAIWYGYSPSVWSAWAAFSPTNDPPFPATGTVKPQYDYSGADAVVRVQAKANKLTPGAKPVNVTWTAAAKPFGYLGQDAPERPDSCRIVLPAFHDVRLIPIDTSSASAGGSYNIDWRIHIEKHLPGYDVNGVHVDGYMDAGPGAPAMDPTCFYCQQLWTWENPSFRQKGITWLQLNSPLCNVPTGGGGGGWSGGGSSIGH